MKNYGAIRKVMIMILLSILGSYCIGAADHKQVTEQKSLQDSFDSLKKSTYDMAASVGVYCKKLYFRAAHYVSSIFYKNDNNIKIQNFTGDVTANLHYCTDGREDCEFNEKVFDDTFAFTGQLDIDPIIDLPIDPASIE